MNNTPNNTTKMLQAILNGQSATNERIDKLDKKLTEKIGKIDQKIDRVERNLTKRIDKIGLNLAYLDDDTPSREEYNKLEDRVEKLEQKATFAT